MFKTALFDCAIEEKCCSVDGGWGVRPLFSSHPGELSSTVPTPGNLPSKAKKKNANARGQCGGVGGGGALGAAGRVD